MILYAGNFICEMLDDKTANMVKCRSTQEKCEVPRCVTSSDSSEYLIKKLSSGSFMKSKVKHLTFASNSCVEEIEPKTFMNSMLESIEIPSSLQKFSGASFYSLKGIKLDIRQENKLLMKDNDGLVYFKHPLALFNGATSRNIKHINIRKSVVEVSSFAFYCNPTIVSVKFPYSLRIIKENSFCSCANLTRICFSNPSCLKEIGEFAFSQCRLKCIAFPKSLKIIRNNAFRSCATLKRIVFPNDSQLEELGSGVFYETSIKEFNLPSETQKIGDSCFCNCHSLDNFVIPPDSKLFFLSSNTFTNTNIDKNQKCIDSIISIQIKKRANRQIT